MAHLFQTYRLEEWTEDFGFERLTGALLDRINYHVRILEMNGDSYSLKQSRGKTDVAPEPLTLAPPNALRGRRVSSVSLQRPFSPENPRFPSALLDYFYSSIDI